MKHLIATSLFCVSLLFGSAVAAQAEDPVDTATNAVAAPAAPDTSAAPAAPAAPAADEDKGVRVKIDLQARESGNGGKAMIDIDTDADAEDDGPVGRVIRKGVADVLEKHVLTNAELSDEEREEVHQAIAELRGTTESSSAESAADSGEAQEQASAQEADKDTAPAAKKAKTRQRFIVDGDDGDNIPSWVGFVASLAVVFTLGLPIIIVALILWFGYRKRRLAHDTINGYLASGKEIPPEIMHNLFRDAGPVAATPRTNLHKGTVNSAIGLGMVVGFNMIDAEFLAAIGFIFLFVGLAQLLIWKLEQGKKNEVDSAQG